jgi:mRNA interferase MazF
LAGRARAEIYSEVEVGLEQGLPEVGAVNCDSLVTVRRAALDPRPVGRLDQVKTAELDRALRYALGIRY